MFAGYRVADAEQVAKGGKLGLIDTGRKAHIRSRLGLDVDTAHLDAVVRQLAPLGIRSPTGTLAAGLPAAGYTDPRRRDIG